MEEEEHADIIKTIIIESIKYFKYIKSLKYNSYNKYNNYMNFENTIQQWVSLDNQLKQINEKTKELREKRNKLEENILQYASSNNLSQSVVNISDGKLKFTQTRVQEPLTFKYLERTLSEVIKNESQVKIIMEHIRQKRENKLVPEIKRFYNK